MKYYLDVIIKDSLKDFLNLKVNQIIIKDLFYKVISKYSDRWNIRGEIFYGIYKPFAIFLRSENIEPKYNYSAKQLMKLLDNFIIKKYINISI
jgi:hypothetical protein